MADDFSALVKISIIECHQATIDGYTYRIQSFKNNKIISTHLYSDEFDHNIIMNTNVLITGLNVYSSLENKNIVPVFIYIKKIRELNPKIKVIIIADIVDNELVTNYIQAGIDGLISKNDHHAILRLGEIVDLVHKNGMYLSGEFKNKYFPKGVCGKLTLRQLEVLSLCAAFPDEGSSNLAKRLNISSSTFRNVLSTIYQKLEVRTRAGAITRARNLGLVQANTASDNDSSNFFPEQL